MCSTCKCKNGLIECVDNCNEIEYEYDSSNTNNNNNNNVQITNLSQRKSRLRDHHHNHKSRNNRYEINELLSNKINSTNNVNINDLEIDDTKTKSACIYDNNIYQFNATWSPIKCSICKCSFNSVVDCFTYECPTLYNCTNVKNFIFCLYLNFVLIF